MSGAVQWWIGDWLNYGEEKWGEMYDKAKEATGLSYSYLRVLKYVAARIQLYFRKYNLDWTHYCTVAPLEPPEQKKWLSYALKPLNSGRDKPLAASALRRAIKESKPSDYPPWPPYSGVQYPNPCISCPTLPQAGEPVKPRLL